MASVAPISNDLARKVGKYARRVATTFDEQSQLISPKTRSIPTVTDKEMQLGKLLGQGGFNIVRELTLVGRKEVYAIKHLRPDILFKPKDFLTGATDLVAEARILNSLSHPNVITLHAVSDVPISDSYVNGGHYFLVLDRLQCTVSDKLKEWREKINKRNLSINSDAYQMQVKERVRSVALPVARALEYLHSKNVIFRDIKPANMGFDLEGTVKLFDFGLAREVDKSGRRMTGSTGSRRYMAPEVALSQFYDVKADVFSFGIFLWELATLVKPFDNMTRSEHLDKVIFADYRPETGPQCGSSQIQELIRGCWKVQAKERPSISEVATNLATEKHLPEHQVTKKASGNPMKFWMKMRPKRLQRSRNESARAA